MRISEYKYNPSFRAIKLTNPDYVAVRDIVFYLKRIGYEPIGHKKVYCNNNLADIIKAGSALRNRTPFHDLKFGAVFFPWCNQAYLMATRGTEQELYKCVKKYDAGAILNLGM